MEKSEQRFVIKFLFLKGLGSKAIHSELISGFGPIACSLPQLKKWRIRLANGYLSCQDQIRPGRPLMFWGRPSPISLRSFRSQVQALFRRTLVNPNPLSNRSFNASLGSGDSLEDRSHIRSQSLKKLIEKHWQSTC
jgi:hypothetical protein